MSKNDTYETLEFIDQPAFRQWLDSNHSKVNGIWLKLHKKNSGLASVSYVEALDVALCYGWIDGQKKGFDELSFLQKFTPRRAKSLWSKRNIEHIARLTKDELMMPAGQEEVDKAKQDGRWDAAYDGSSTMTFPDSFLAMLKKNPRANAAFERLNKSERYSIGWKLQTAKTQKTMQARLNKIMESLNKPD